MSEQEEERDIDIDYDEKLEMPEGSNFMILLVGVGGDFSYIDIGGLPSEEQMRFVEDLVILERRSVVMRFVMFVERLNLRIEGWLRKKIYGGKL